MPLNTNTPERPAKIVQYWRMIQRRAPVWDPDKHKKRGKAMSLLYRGVSKKMDSNLNGELVPKGNKSKIVPLSDDNIPYNGSFTHGVTETNAVRAHHIESGLYDGCYISTTKDKIRVREFATNDYTEDGWVYVINPNLFKKYDVKTKEFPDPLYPDELEISIRAKDCGNIPLSVVVKKYEVDRYGKIKQNK